MKKIFYLFAAVLLFASCEKEEIGATATVSMSGQWYVRVDAVDENDNVVYTGEEFFDLGNFMLLTYNVSDNSSDVLLIDDLTNLWTFRTKVDCDLSSLTFSAPEPDKYVYATEYDESDEYTYNNFYYKAGSIDAEKWQWYKEGEEQYEENNFEMPSKNVVLTGKFEEDKYTVSYDFYDSSLPANSTFLIPSSSSFSPGEKVTLPKVNNTETHDFVGWNKENNFEA